MSDHAAVAESHAPHGEHEHGHDAGHGGVGKYLVVFAALCVLTTMSFWTKSDFPFKWPYHDTPKVGWAFMMAVSCTKALLVILFFMHVLYEANWKFVLTIPAAMMSIFLILMLVPDVGNRLDKASQERQDRMATQGSLPPGVEKVPEKH